jgi:hypothetical protein
VVELRTGSSAWRADLVDEIEAIVKADDHWPQRGWDRASTMRKLAEFRGLSRQIVLDAVRDACGRAPIGPIHSLKYFHDPIRRAHTAAVAEPQLPSTNPGGQRGRHRKTSDSWSNKIAAAERLGLIATKGTLLSFEQHVLLTWIPCRGSVLTESVLQM